MLQDTDLFDKLEQYMTLGDVHAKVEWSESVSPDERYNVHVSWKYRRDKVGQGQFIIEPIVGTDDFRLFWIHLAFKDLRYA